MNVRTRLRLCFSLTTTAILLTLDLSGSSQTPQPPPANLKDLAFDVTSVKPAKPGCLLVQIGPSPDGFHLECIPLSALIHYAYRYNVFNEERVLGEPSWTKSAAYDIDAKVDIADAPAFEQLSLDQKAAMLQSVLMTRFNLAAHKDQRELPVYALVIAKGGSRLKAFNPDDPATRGLPISRTRGRGKIEAHNCPIDGLFAYLSPLQGRTIIDRTGLTGKYDFTLTWRPDSMPADAPAEEESRPDIFTAVQEQLGLKFEPRKAPLDVLIVDRIDKPSAD